MKEIVENLELEKDFTFRAYSKAELAMLYNPAQCLTLALQTLARWMRTNTLLMAELETVQYNKYRRVFTPKEVAIIVKHLGNP